MLCCGKSANAAFAQSDPLGAAAEKNDGGKHDNDNKYTKEPLADSPLLLIPRCSVGPSWAAGGGPPPGTESRRMRKVVRNTILDAQVESRKHRAHACTIGCLTWLNLESKIANMFEN